MNINWVIGEHIILDPTTDINHLKKIGSMWGSWKTYRTCPTDNTICHDTEKARDLVKNKFHTMSNLYVHTDAFKDVETPQNIREFGGNFEHEVENRDEIICIHLCASIADIVLLFGFDWSTGGLKSKSQHYRGLTLQAIKSYPDTQFLLVDHVDNIDPDYTVLDNLMSDSLKNILSISP
jgi:hypothetical protein